MLELPLVASKTSSNVIGYFSKLVIVLETKWFHFPNKKINIDK